MTLSVRNDEWIPPAGKVGLDVGCAHLWRASLEQSGTTIERVARWLSEDELERAARFRHDRHRNRFIVGRAMLRDVLAQYRDCAAEEITFTYLAHGKPILSEKVNATKLEFNLSHSGDVAICAVAKATPLGVDVERIRSLRDMQGLADRFFSSTEAQQIRAAREDEQLANFFRCWTRKEAYVKATGQGITCRLDSFAVSVGPNDPAQLVHIDQNAAAAANWSMVSIVPTDGYVGALATEAPLEKTCCWDWNPPEST